MCQVLVLVIVDKAEIVTVWERKMIKNLFKKWLGIDKLQAEKDALQIVRDKAVAETVLAQEAEEQAKMDPKARATARGEAYVAVLDTHINKDNVRNGFFELDWNDLFIVQLKQAGYGFDGDPDEEIVDRWFRDLAGNMLAEAGEANPGRTIGGYINVTKLGNGKAQVE
jgi:hypothetical protein